MSGKEETSRKFPSEMPESVVLLPNSQPPYKGKFSTRLPMKDLLKDPMKELLKDPVFRNNDNEEDCFIDARTKAQYEKGSAEADAEDFSQSILPSRDAQRKEKGFGLKRKGVQPESVKAQFLENLESSTTEQSENSSIGEDARSGEMSRGISDVSEVVVVEGNPSVQAELPDVNIGNVVDVEVGVVPEDGPFMARFGKSNWF